MRPLFRLLLLLLPLLLSAPHGAAQPSIQVLGGANLLFARNGSDEFALPTDGRTLVPAFAFALVPRGRLGLQLEADLPRTMTKLVPGAIKAGPVTYVVTQRNLVLSAMGRVPLSTGKVGLIGLVGPSLARNRTNVRYSVEPAQSGPAETRLALSGGLELDVTVGRMVIAAPTLRFHYITGLEGAENGFRPSRALLTLGASVGWRSGR